MQKVNIDNNRKGTILAFISIALFASYPVFGKVLLENVSPFIILVLNQTLAGIILLLVLDFFKKIQEMKKASRHDLKFMYLIALFSAVAGPLLFLLGLNLSSATNTILIAKSEAVLTAILAVLILKDKITTHQIVGSIVMFFGIILIATNNFANGLAFKIGDIFIFLAAISYAFGTILFKRFMHHIPPEIIATLRNLFGASMLFLISLFMADFTGLAEAMDTRFVLSLLGLVVLTTILGQYLWYKALEITTATNVVLAGLTSPLIAIFYAVIFLHETITSSQIWGGMCIMAGLIVLELHFDKTRTKEDHLHHMKIKHWSHH